MVPIPQPGGPVIMRRLITLVVLLFVTSTASAGDKKPLTPERVGQLMTILRSDLSEDNRLQAAEELGHANGMRHPEVVPALIESLRKDPKPAVRGQALDSLARIRPVSKDAGRAIEAAKDDPSFKVRWKVSGALRTYHSAGYGEQEKKTTVSASAPRKDPPPPQQQQPESPNGGWLYNLFNKQSTQPKMTQKGIQTGPPPLADDGPVVIGAPIADQPRITVTPPPVTIAPTGPAGHPLNNPFEGIKSAPAGPAPGGSAPVAPAPRPASGAPIIPELPSRPDASPSR
jgi:HEAT repeats